MIIRFSLMVLFSINFFCINLESSENNEGIRLFLNEIISKGEIEKHIDFVNIKKIELSEDLAFVKMLAIVSNVSVEDVKSADIYMNKGSFYEEALDAYQSYAKRIPLEILNKQFEIRSLRNDQIVVLFKDEKDIFAIPLVLFKKEEGWKIDARCIPSTLYLNAMHRRIVEIGGLQKAKEIKASYNFVFALDHFPLPSVDREKDYSYLIETYDLACDSEKKLDIHRFVCYGAFFHDILERNGKRLLNDFDALSEHQKMLISSQLNLSINGFNDKEIPAIKDAYVKAKEIIEKMTKEQRKKYIIDEYQVELDFSDYDLPQPKK